MSFQAEKDLVRAHYEALAAARPETVADILAARTSADWHWRGLHPFHDQTGAEAVADVFWTPFLTAMTRVQRREDIFFAGLNEIDGFASTWVVSMGHLMALFDAPFLGIPPTGKIVMLRYAEFNKVEGGRITETAFFCDLVHLMTQAGVFLLPAAQTAQHLVQPGPRTHDGLLFDARPAEEGRDTLALINRMIGDIAQNSNDGTGRKPRDATPQAELSRCWHDDMLWWGPEGIGATYTIDRYVKQHQQPFRRKLTDRRFNGHLARLAEGDYGGFFGWPNLSVRSLGGYMGLPESDRHADMRVVDIYRREGDKLAENWIFIDMLHFLNQQGIDLLGRLRDGEAASGAPL